MYLTSIEDRDASSQRWRTKGNVRSGAADASHLQQLLDAERMLRAAAEDRAERLSNELLELNRKHRDLESEFRDLALQARAYQQQPAQPAQEAQDVSTLQRLAKCRSSVEASTETIKELRRLNEDMHAQVERVQKELKEAVQDVDDTERDLNACNARLAAAEGQLRQPQVRDDLPPPPPPPF